MSGSNLAQHSRPEQRHMRQTFVKASHEGPNRTCDRLLHHRIEPDGQIRYLVLWAPTWEHDNDISDFEQGISNYQPKSANLRWQSMGTIQEKSPSYRDEVHVGYTPKSQQPPNKTWPDWDLDGLSGWEDADLDLDFEPLCYSPSSGSDCEPLLDSWRKKTAFVGATELSSTQKGQVLDEAREVDLHDQTENISEC